MSGKNFVIVESPTKAKTLKKFLPKDFVVEASMGHLRDLPQTASDVPAKYKKEPWGRLGIDIENDFSPIYVNVKGKAKTIQGLKKRLKEADTLYLATDEDREGESISWHLLQLLRPKIPVKRMVFHEITKSAITKSLSDTRDIDEHLVQAQETRRLLDRLVGFTLSPLIWKKIAYGLSAGRVQSVSLRLIVERERERAKFIEANYWDIKANLLKGKQSFEAKLQKINGAPIAQGKDFEPTTGKIKKDSIVHLNKEKALDLTSKLQKAEWTVLSVEEKSMKSKPLPPFITSTLQQEANRKLGMSSKQAMRTAQALYEQGLITYMRTDSPALSKEAINAARDAVVKLYGKEYLSKEVRQFASKSKGAQEAHEAIRPAGENFVHPKDTGLDGGEFKLYDLIWKRTMGCQMAEAEKMSMKVEIEALDTLFTAHGRRIVFPGHLRAYVEGSDDPEAGLEDREVHLPKLEKGDKININELSPEEHHTRPIARFTEASLVQRLEKEGIGRPSTYASIIGTIIDRGYTTKNGHALVPSFIGMAVVQLLEGHFSDLVDYQFTSRMEEALDEIAIGKRDALPYLKEFYLGKNGLRELVDSKEKLINAEQSRTIIFDHSLAGVELKVGRFGPYLVKYDEKNQESFRASIPEDVAPADLNEGILNEIIEIGLKGPTPLGKCPNTGKNVYCLIGRYGPYVQLGEKEDENVKRSSVTKDINYREITLEQALQLLKLPRELGVHPESKKMILANRGRFGPYINHDGDFRSIKEPDDVYTIDLARALEMLAEEKVTRRGAKVVEELGVYKKTKKKITLMDGKYGQFIKWGNKNVSIPKDFKEKKIDLKMATEIIDLKEKKA